MDDQRPVKAPVARRLRALSARVGKRPLAAAVVASLLIGALVASWPSSAGEQAQSTGSQQCATPPASAEIAVNANAPRRPVPKAVADACLLPCQWQAGHPQVLARRGARPPCEWPNAGRGINTLYGHGSYVEPGRIEHIDQYRLRVDDLLDVVFRRTRAEQARPYELQVGDKIRVELRKEPDPPRDMEIQPDGTIALPLIGTVRATRRSVAQLREEIEQAYRKYDQEPGVTVTPVQLNTRLQDLLDTVDRRFGTGGLVQEVRVTPDGSIAMPAVGSVYVQGLTLDELRHELNLRFGLVVEGLDIQPVLRARAPRFVFVLGEVATPGRYTLEGPTTVMQGIALAGGITTAAAGKLCNVIVFRRGADWRMMATKISVRGSLAGGYVPHHGVDELWLADSDVVVVPKSEFLIIDEYLDLLFTRGIYSVFPFQGASLSFAKLSTL
jgi:polysaccharide export outer membrane protein